MRKLNLYNKINKNSALLLITLLSTTTAVQAANTHELYGRFSLGGSIPSSLDYEGNITTGNTTNGAVDVNLNPGVQTAVAFGFQPNKKYNQIQSRYELELAHRRHTTDSVDSTDTTGIDHNNGGSLGVITLFSNAYLDFNGVQMVQPYIGAGIGAAFVDQDIRYSPPASTAHVNMHDSDTVFAAQLMAGVSRRLTDALSLQADVKYLSTLDFETDRVGTVNTGTFDSNYSETSINIGLRYAF